MQPSYLQSGKRNAPATERNREPIAALLRELLPRDGLLLEIAAGTGEHAAYLAPLFPGLTWQPSDPDPAALTSIEAWQADSGADNLLPPVFLDAASSTWPIGRADAILCINMVHISPWSATEGLMRGAARLLPPGGPLILYGPYRRAGVPTAPSNEAFDESLRGRNPDWGLRTLQAVSAEAEASGLTLERVVEMPANNLTVVFTRGRSPSP
jgi:SAM-dependent methyltransferase